MTAPPTKAIIDSSCFGVPGVGDPEIQQAGLRAMMLSLNHSPEQVAEYGFFSSPDLIGDGHSAGPIFTDGYPDKMRQWRVDLNRPSYWESLLRGRREPDLFVHTHPNYGPPSPVGKVHDPEMAEYLKMPVAAIDKAGNITCVRPRERSGK